MVIVFNSRHTIGLKNGETLLFNRGEIVDVELLNGKIIKGKIDSDLMTHDEADGDKTGYEIIAFDDNKRCFIPRKRIIGWK